MIIVFFWCYVREMQFIGCCHWLINSRKSVLFPPGDERLYWLANFVSNFVFLFIDYSLLFDLTDLSLDSAQILGLLLAFCRKLVYLLQCKIVFRTTIINKYLCIKYLSYLFSVLIWFRMFMWNIYVLHLEPVISYKISVAL